MAVTGRATFSIDLPPTSTPPPAPTGGPAYESKVLRVHKHDGDRDLERLQRELEELGRLGWYPSAVLDDVLILSRLRSAPPNPATKVTLTWGPPQAIPKG